MAELESSKDGHGDGLSAPSKIKLAFLRHPFARFLIGGMSTTLVSYLVYLFALRFSTYLVAYSLAYAVGIAWAYFVNTLFVFQRTFSLASATAFPIVYLIQYVIGSLLMYAIVDVIRLPEFVAPLLVVVLTLPLTYALSKWIIAGPRSNPKGPPCR